MDLPSWIDAYVRAWSSNDPDEIGALFTDDATYRQTPYAQPWAGREQIVKEWLARRDKPGETGFSWAPLSVDGDLAVITGRTVYPTEVYSNLWVIRFAADGRCREFTEWWMPHP